MSKQLVFKLDVFGRSQVEAVGFTGGECATHIAKANKVFGQAGQTQDTSDMYLTEEQTEQNLLFETE